MIHVCFGFHDKSGTYSKFAGTSMLSLFENTSAPVTVHILHDDTLTQDNREKFIYLAGRFSQAVKFYNVEKLCADKFLKFVELAPEVKISRVSVGAFYRLLIPQILPQEIDKIIYLDSDIVVNLDIKELWQIEPGEKILAAVPEILNYKSVDEMNRCFKLCANGLVKHEDYFNSGVLLMNLNLLRGEEKTILDGFRFRAQNHRYNDYFDQNVLNYCFASRTLKLPAKFNKPTQYVRVYKEPLAKKIYHYSGGSFGFGLGLDMSDALNRLWMKYFIRTPWFDEGTIGRLYEGFLSAQNKLNKAALNLSASMSGKTRAFLITEDNLDLLLENFSVREDEEVFLLKDGMPLQIIADIMKAARGEKIFFVLISRFPFDVLEEAGFVRGKDFADGLELLTSEYNFYSLVKAM